MIRTRLTAALTLALVPTAFAQSTNISSTDKFSWSENCGWMNWADAGNPTGSQGVVVGAFILSGFAWGENIGWINLGDGLPDTGAHYSNTTGVDSGINLDPVTGHLWGMAWSENTGWINFAGGAMASPPQPARVESGRLRGYAWGENIGWINLDDATHFVGVPMGGPCDGDVNCDFALDGFDVEVQEKAVGGDMTDYCLPDPDFNGDLALDGFDVEAVEVVVGGGACP